MLTLKDFEKYKRSSDELVKTFGNVVEKIILVGYGSEDDKKFYVIGELDEVCSNNIDIIVIRESEYRSIDESLGQDSILLFDRSSKEFDKESLWRPVIRRVALKMLKDRGVG